MCEDVLKAMKYQWHEMDLGTIHLVDQDNQMPVTEQVKIPQVYALTRTKLNLEEAPTGKKLEAVKQMMLRVHRASGHSGFSNLQRLLEARGSPRWAIELAGTLVCPECQESALPRPRPPASLEEEPKMFEVVGTDIFEYEDETDKKKYKGIIWRDRATGLTMLEILKELEGGHWEPTTKDIIQSLTRWMMFHPAPTWIVADAATYYTSQELMDFCGRSGVGLTIVPAEAHWLMGSEEQAIGVAKRAVSKMRKEFESYDVATRWVNGGAQLADSLTKIDRKIILQFMAQRQFWRLVHDEKFTSGRKLQKRALEKKMLEDEKKFVSWVKHLAEKNCWPWDEGPEERYSPFT